MSSLRGGSEEPESVTDIQQSFVKAYVTSSRQSNVGGSSNFVFTNGIDAVELTAELKALDVVPEAGDQILDVQVERETNEHVFDCIKPSELVYPYSVYDEFQSPLPRLSERDALAHLLSEKSQADAEIDEESEEYVEIELSDFSIYLPGNATRHAWEFCGLQNLWAKAANSNYVFDGILSIDGRSCWVQRISFSICSIGNYGADFDHVDGNIWLQSSYNESRKMDIPIYYKLRTPSLPYRRYFDDFLWLTNLSKYFIDFMGVKEAEGCSVSIHHFRHDFVAWLLKAHESSDNCQQWYTQYNSADFRCAISANIHFLYKEAVGVGANIPGSSYEKHVIWNEVKYLDHIPAQKMKEDKTIVTPYVYDCFSHLKSGAWLKCVSPAEVVNQRRESLADILHLNRQRVQEDAGAEVPLSARVDDFDSQTLAVGDVVAVTMDDLKISNWKDEKSKWRKASDFWYVYIQGIRGEHPKRRFDVIWLYKPEDTTCAIMKYPWSNEIFFSDHCSCGERKSIREKEILFRVRIAWSKVCEASDKNVDFFVRTQYLQETSSYVTFNERHKVCIHKRDDVKTKLQELVDTTSVGDTVLVNPPFPSDFKLEPAEILEYIQDKGQGRVRLRRLPRCHTLLDKINYERPPPRPNELVYSDEEFMVRAELVNRKCHIRFFSLAQLESGSITTPYDRDGTGDAFYITSIFKADSECVQSVSRDNAPKFRQGFSPAVPGRCPKLKGMDLYCGGGTYGRGLEEGGAIENIWAVDLNKNALHTYHANLQPGKVDQAKLFYGSVDDLLAQALAGNPKNSPLIPQPGEVDFVSAGSPCTGFSLLNQNKNDMKGLKNQSLVASVAAYIDFYRPKYALLENVITMASKKANRDQDMLSQLICAFVGMGYQLELFVLDSWSFGSAQSRSRLFVSISAPGLPVPQHPGLSHSHPERTWNRGLGQCANGLPFGKRRFEMTPFEFVTASEATADLPDIGDGRTGSCIPYPDHRAWSQMTDKSKAQIESIPLHPFGMNLVKTSRAGLLTKAQEQVFPSRLTRSGKLTQGWLGSSKAYERIHPGKLFATVTTSLKVRDRDSGKSLHWNQQRLMSVMEARRAQSYPDHEVIIGSTQAQWRIIGNSVARTVALALGLSIRAAWLDLDPEVFKLQPLVRRNVAESKSTMSGYMAIMQQPLIRRPNIAGLKSGVGRLQTPPPSNAPTFTPPSVAQPVASSEYATNKDIVNKEYIDVTNSYKRALRENFSDPALKRRKTINERDESVLLIHADTSKIRQLDRAQESSSVSSSNVSTAMISPFISNDILNNDLNDHATRKATVFNVKLQAPQRESHGEIANTRFSGGSGLARLQRTNLQRFIPPTRNPDHPVDTSPLLNRPPAIPPPPVLNINTGQGIPRYRQGVVEILAPRRLQTHDQRTKVELIVLSDSEDESLDELVVEPRRVPPATQASIVDVNEQPALFKKVEVVNVDELADESFYDEFRDEIEEIANKIGYDNTDPKEVGRMHDSSTSITDAQGSDSSPHRRSVVRANLAATVGAMRDSAFGSVKTPGTGRIRKGGRGRVI